MLPADGFTGLDNAGTLVIPVLRISKCAPKSAIAVSFGSVLAACRLPKTVHGRVIDYETHEPIAGVPDVSFTYVYDPGGSRYLPYDTPPRTS